MISNVARTGRTNLVVKELETSISRIFLRSSDGMKRGCGEHEVERARERTSMAKWAFHRRNWHYLDHQDEGRAHMSHKV